jgi:hypothetical protein
MLIIANMKTMQDFNIISGNFEVVHKCIRGNDASPFFLLVYLSVRAVSFDFLEDHVIHQLL